MIAKSFFLSLAAIIVAAPTMAADRLRIALGNPGVGESGICDLAQSGGFFAKNGIDAEIFYTPGSAETIQAVLAGSADVAVSVGTLGALAVYGKGAPIRAIAPTFTGDSNMFLYVKGDSPITKIEQTANKSVAYSNAGSSSQMMVLEAKHQFGVDFKPTATGSGVATLTQVMTGQIDVGWSGAPFAVDKLETGEIRLIMKASDLAAMAGQSSRIVVAFQPDLQKRPDVYGRFLVAYRETVAWIYETPEGLKAYAQMAKINEKTAQRTLNEFLPRAAVQTDKIYGLEQNMKIAVDFKYLSAPLTKDQLDEFVKTPAPR